jgi:uncharacterized protein
MHLSYFGNRLEVGLDGPLSVREEIFQSDDACRVLYISDIHLRRRRSGQIVRQIAEKARQHKIDAVLLGGDLVDHRSELSELRKLVSVLSSMAPLFAVGGNHDRWAGIELVANAIRDAGGHWIHDGNATIIHSGRTISISGPGGIADITADFRVKCAHFPTIWKAAREQGCNLVLAGHLHGCQAVVFEYAGGLFPGKLLYPLCMLRSEFDNSHLVVSRGVSDLIPIRWRCPRELVLCHV